MTFPLPINEMNVGMMVAMGIITDPVSTIVLMGDSRVQGMYLDGSKRNKGTNNQWNQANRMLGNRITVVGNFGVAGSDPVENLTLIDQAVATGAGMFVYQGGVNGLSDDIPVGTPTFAGDQLTTLWGAIWYMCEKARAAGMAIGLWLEAGATSLTAPRIAARNDLNRKMRSYAQSTPNVTLYDLPTWGLVDPNSTTSIVWKTDAVGDIVSNDGTHLTTVGGRFIGGFLADQVRNTFAATAVPPYDTAAFVPGSGSPILTPNPMFRVTTGGGSVGSGNSGTLPGSVSGSRIGGSSAVFSIVASPDGNGNDLVMVVTNTASVTNDRARVAMNLNTAAMTGISQWLETGCQIDVDPGARGIQSVTLGTNFTADSVSYFNNDAISDATRLGDRGGYTKTDLKTDKLLIPSQVAATPSFFITAYAFPGEDGTATIRIRRPWARLVNVGGYPP